MAHKTIKHGRMELAPVKNGSEWGLFICKTHSGMNFFVERCEEDVTGYHKGVFWTLYRWDDTFGDIDDLKTTCDLPNYYREDCQIDSFDRLKDTLPAIIDDMITSLEAKIAYRKRFKNAS